MTAFRVVIIFCVILATVTGGTIDTPETKLKDIKKELQDAWTRNELSSFATSLPSAQNGTGNAAADIGQAVTNALSDIENAIKRATDRFNQTAQSVLQLVKTLERAGDACLLTATPLDNATLGFRADVEGCLNDDVETTLGIGDKAREIEYDVGALMRQTQHTVYLCSASNIASNGICWTENLPALVSQTLSLMNEVQSTQLQLLNLLPMLNLKSQLCTTIALAKRSKQAQNIITDSIKCFGKQFSRRQ